MTSTSSNTVDTRATTGLGATTILIDDVLVPSTRNPLDLPLTITRATVLVHGTPEASDIFSLWSYPAQPDGSPGLAPVLVANANITFPAGRASFQRVSFGNGSTPLFTVTPDFLAEPGFGLLPGPQDVDLGGRRMAVGGRTGCEQSHRLHAQPAGQHDLSQYGTRRAFSAAPLVLPGVRRQPGTRPGTLALLGRVSPG
jgi:hypothetical protein